jgi:hypothetical protein
MDKERLPMLDWSTYITESARVATNAYRVMLALPSDPDYQIRRKTPALRRGECQ